MVSPVGLHLFDGTSNSTIMQIAELLIKFPSGEVFNMTFYVTPLNSIYRKHGQALGRRSGLTAPA